MHTFSDTNQTGRQPFSSALCLACILATAVHCHADIYRFVTVDGVESFTDAPLNKGAKVVIKEHAKTQKQRRSTTYLWMRLLKKLSMHRYCRQDNPFLIPSNRSCRLWEASSPPALV